MYKRQQNILETIQNIKSKKIITGGTKVNESDGYCAALPYFLFNDKEKEIKNNIYEYFKRLKDDWDEIPKHFITSSEKSMGKDELLSYINKINDSIPSF